MSSISNYAKTSPKEEKASFRVSLLPFVCSAVDQTLFSVTNFILNVLLARQLSSAEYGAFVIAQGFYLLFATIHIGVILEPMLIIGSGKSNKNLRPHLGLLMALNVLVYLTISVLMVLCGIFYPRIAEPLELTCCVFALAVPCLLVHYTLRRACYIDKKSKLAIYSIASYFFILLVILVFERYGWLTVWGFPTLMSLGRLSVSILLWKKLSSSISHENLSEFGSISLFTDTGRWDDGCYSLRHSLRSALRFCPF